MNWKDVVGSSGGLFLRQQPNLCSDQGNYRHTLQDSQSLNSDSNNRACLQLKTWMPTTPYQSVLT